MSEPLIAQLQTLKNCLLHIAYCQLVIAYCLLPSRCIIDSLIMAGSTLRYELPIAYCFLLYALCSMLYALPTQPFFKLTHSIPTH